jgi:aminoglycoside 6-adenylyltransferase
MLNGAKVRGDKYKNSLLATMDLFRSIAVVIAEKLDYKYPAEADNYSTDWVLKVLSSGRGLEA